MQHTKIQLLEATPVPRAILELAVPTMVGMLVQVFYNMTDTFFVGQLNDPNQVAAVAIIMPIFMITMALSGIFGNGGASYLSRLLGSKEQARAQQTLATAWLSGIILGVVVMIAGFYWMPAILSVSGASAQTYPYAASYLRIILAGSVVIMVNFAAGQLLRAEGAAKEAMFGMAIGTGANIILDPLFIFTFRQGVAGAAIATVIANAMALGYYLSYYLRRKSLIPLTFKHLKFEWPIYRELFKIGVPASISQLLMSCAHMFMNNIAASYGDVVVAASGIDMRLFTMPIMLSIGLATGTQPLFGYSYGAKNLPRLKAAIKTAIVMATGIVVTFTIIFALFPAWFIRVFIRDAEVISTGVIILRAQLIGLPAIGIQMVLMNAMQAMGKGLPALIVSLARQGIVFVPALLLLNMLFGFSGYIYAMAVADILSMVLSVGFFLWIIRIEHLNQHAPATSQPGTVKTSALCNLAE
jgi:multidrug efflux pump